MKDKVRTKWAINGQVIMVGQINLMLTLMTLFLTVVRASVNFGHMSIVAVDILFDHRLTRLGKVPTLYFFLKGAFFPTVWKSLTLR